MKTVIHRAEERGGGEHGWLSTRYSFSFADWYEPTRMGFGTLRVINDDTIAPASGFPMHAHQDMEIITLVLRGTVTHKDSLGNVGTVPAGDVQVMSAGTGIVHSEYNASATEPLALFQIWIEPNKNGVRPRYAQKSFADAKKSNFQLLVSPTGAKESLGIHQDAYICLARVDRDHPLNFELQDKRHGVYLFVIGGSIDVAGETLGARDAMGITETDKVRIESPKSAELLIIEVPMH